MSAYCLVDTSAAHAGGVWAPGTYRLFIKLTAASEIPRTGPFEFTVIEGAL